MIQDLYNITFNLYSNEITSYDVIGSEIRSLVYKDSKSCYCTSLSGKKEVYNGKFNILADYLLYCDPLDIKTTDLIYINLMEDNGASGWFQIVYIDNCNNMSHHFEIYLLSIGAPQISEVSSSSSSSSSN